VISGTVPLHIANGAAAAAAAADDRDGGGDALTAGLELVLSLFSDLWANGMFGSRHV